MENDCISRQWLMGCVSEGWIKFDTEKDENRFIHLVRDIAPSAQPRWIPCNERLPELDERVLVYTVANEYHVWDAMPHRGEGYEWEDEEGLYHDLYEVEMWMPLPELYAERRRDE